MRKTKLAIFAMMLLVAGAGCTTGPTFFERHDKNSRYEPGTDAWWAEKAALPPGVRQQNKKGKIWPMRPRSTQEPQQFSHTYHSEHYWPLPYTCQDRQWVNQTESQFVSLGWQEETTLYDRHFDPATQQLNRAGELQLSYLVHVIPLERRTVHIQSTFDTALDEIRLEGVTAAVGRMNHGVVSVPIAMRDCQEVGRPAAEVETINTLYNSTIPSPRLGSSSGSGSSGGATGP